MNYLKLLAVFGAGLGIGFVTSKYILEEKYKDIAADEIESIKKRYKEKEDALKMSNDNINKPSVEEYSKTIEDLKYAPSKKDSKPEPEKEVVNDEESDSTITIITSKQFDEENGYDKIAINYYKEDGIVSDVDDIILDDRKIDEWIGEIGLVEASTTNEENIYIRNDDIEIDFNVYIFDNSYSNSTD